MIKCQACGTQNLDSSQYCDECGDSLQKYKAPDKANSASDVQTNEKLKEEAEPIFKSASVTSIGIPTIAEEQEVETIQANETDLSQEIKDDSNATSVQRNAGEQTENKGAGVHSKLVIERGESIGTEFSLASEISNIGRWDADNGVFPDVDLDAYDEEAKVSRKHARILYKNGQFMLEDLGSTNGTFINRGRRLIPGNPHNLKENDEIIVGKTFLRFQLV